jgi:hypothetical protein
MIFLFFAASQQTFFKISKKSQRRARFLRNQKLVQPPALIERFRASDRKELRRTPV